MELSIRLHVKFESSKLLFSVMAEKPIMEVDGTPSKSCNNPPGFYYLRSTARKEKVSAHKAEEAKKVR
jgi:hypothetical protein